MHWRPGAANRTRKRGPSAKRNMDRCGHLIIGRLAVHKDFQGRRIGPGLLRDAVLRTLQAADIAGVRAILVHAISEQARQFYEDCGFIASPMDPMTLMITVAEAAKAFVGKDVQ